MKPTVAAIIQARLGSTRLPGKVLKLIGSKTIFEIIVLRLREAMMVDKIILATTDSPKDDDLVEVAGKLDLHIFRGEEENVLKRFYDAAAEFDCDVIVRVTSDDPLKDPKLLDMVVERFFDHVVDYCSNTISPTFPEGLDVEVFSKLALQKAYNEASKMSDLEHVTPYMWRNPDIFRLENFSLDNDYSNYSITVDTSEDLRAVSALFEHFNFDYLIGYDRVITEISTNPRFKYFDKKGFRNVSYNQQVEKEK